ncbi:Vacuolar sorting protein 39/Transforming growth factor beta receptor-associated domain 2 [Metarhizium guizhouense ARSEF 977]|uniref:Vacuolar sorting protein 39/Transforming growth factor beta receptor-associated domain 2 n=1 Tax=Metarhizium guizhouense (strain ARSEF 977) TaxID=1276136 RepID=A0A0B4H1U1_METGA|nr:Vacuolar sorting protein 39/Transforming growth factor beta receptor-associated domain 2 [Metarhizium guizhouense ARSEF 977]
MATQTSLAASSGHRAAVEDGPYILRPLLEEIPLASDGSDSNVKINCVEFYDGNLYIGTSASEVLHFVQIPPDSNDMTTRPVYIQASRLSPVSVESPSSRSAGQGVQEILLLPRIGKACILCNSTAAFYSLPELSPVSGISFVKNCTWIGGVDLNDAIAPDGSVATSGNDATILLSLKSKIQVVRLADKVLEAPKVTFAGSVLSVRRDSIACVADSRSYALLDICRQLTIPLMSISTLDETPVEDVGRVQSLRDTAPDPPLRTGPTNLSTRSANTPDHSRNPSQNDNSSSPQQPSSPVPSTSLEPRSNSKSPSPPTDKPLPLPPGEDTSTDQNVQPKKHQTSNVLKPHISSPNSEEFLLVIGTKLSEPGVGMFVSLDGEPTRATLQFEKYPEQIVVDGNNFDMTSSQTGFGEEEDCHVLASISKESDNGLSHGIEIQHINAGQEANPKKHWLEARGISMKHPYGLRTLLGKGQVRLGEIVSKLSQKRFSPFPGPLEASSSLKSSDSRTALSIEQLSKEKELFERDDSQDDDSLPEGWETTRNTEGEQFVRRLADVETRLAVWNGNCIWWAMRNPLIIQLDALLDEACPKGQMADMDKSAVYAVLKLIRGRDARTELEYMTLDYLRQKAGLLLLINVLSVQKEQVSEGDLNALEKLLVDSKLDPRVVLSLIPGIRNDIIEGKQGIWIYAGVKKIAESYLRSVIFERPAKSALQDIELQIMHFFRRFLSAWRKMKGFGSVPDEVEVFRTVDAALLISLLELDQRSPRGTVHSGAVRSELNDVVDKGVDCFDRAVDILESYHRLFMLSRLYQSRKMAGDVLATWKRIIEGEEDSASEFYDGEQRVRDYLKKISSQALVQEYGIWLAKRNPRLGVQVFAEDEGRAPRFEPARAVEILRAEAPDAVKYYLEHLVFAKGLTSYVNELLNYYLDVVLGDLRSSAASRETVMATYEAYRALQGPKPTYHHFLLANTPPDGEIWKSRLRLLQLLGGTHDYDTAAIAERIGSLPGDLLVPETIILAGHQRRHEEALRLLVHKLGDYDTAVSYCLRGGSSVYGHLDGRQGGVSMPETEQQRRLFQVVLHEFLSIADVSHRIEQTGALLERFGGWFEVEEVLGLVPDAWSVDVVAGFLIGAMKRLVREKNESVVRRALSGAENLRVNYDLVVGVEQKGPSIEAQN